VLVVDLCRRVDNKRGMSNTLKSPGRQIVGFSLSPEMARAVKAEAAYRGLSLRKLFEELWAGYEDAKGEGSSGPQ